MSWLFSQALGAEYSAATCSDGEPFAQLNVMPTPHKFWRNDKTMEFSSLSRFGLTCAVLTEDRGAELLTWFLEDSHARTSAPQAKEPESTANAPASGAKWRELSTRYDPASCSWKTHQCLWEEDLPWSSVILPRWGLMRDGVCWELPTLERRTSANDAGLWPTPNVPNGGRSCAHVTDWRGKDGRTAYHNGKKVQVGLEHAAKYWPTPTSTLGTNGGKVTPAKSREGGTLIEALSNRTQWATPTVCGNYNRAGSSSKSGDGLATQAGGSLNPTWVEWLMGWPLGWTELKPLGMDKFHKWQQQHSEYFQASDKP